MIFFLMGKSSSGKDTIYKNLLEDETNNLNNMVTYTTRPVREGEREGEEYHFVDEAKLKEFEEKGLVIEKRSYDTIHGVWVYFTVKDGEFEPSKKDYLGIGTLESYISIRDYYGKDLVVPIMIELDDGIRLQRALDREKGQKEPKYREMCRRFLADEDDFSDEKLKEAGVHETFCNENLWDCIDKIRKYITDARRDKG